MMFDNFIFANIYWMNKNEYIIYNEQLILKADDFTDAIRKGSDGMVDAAHRVDL
jgi:hypothetical protein